MTLTLAFNAGSSTLKYRLFESESSVLSGVIDYATKRSDFNSLQKDAFQSVCESISRAGIHLIDIQFVGHRVVHGGKIFVESLVITDEVIEGISSLIKLAPLHIPASLEVIRASLDTFSNATNVAVFDTAFHRTLPASVYTYPINREVAHEYGIRKYGFHGISHQYVTEVAAHTLGKDVDQLNAISCHLGAGSSVTAIQQGKSVETSMGFTPLSGLMMATRSGDIDPGVLLYLLDEHVEPKELYELLNHKSGLFGIAGTSDMREIRERAKSDHQAKLAREMYIQRVIYYLGAYLALVPNVEVVIFTGGIGENDEELRLEIAAKLEHLGIGDKIKLLVIQTNEEVAIARECWNVGNI